MRTGALTIVAAVCIAAGCSSDNTATPTSAATGAEPPVSTAAEAVTESPPASAAVTTSSSTTTTLATSADVPVAEAACRRHIDDGYAYLWSETTTVGQIQASLATFVTTPPSDVVRTSVMPDADPAADAYMCWATSVGAPPDYTTQYFVGPNDETRGICGMAVHGEVVDGHVNLDCYGAVV